MSLTEKNVWFQQDGATAYTSGRLIEVLREAVPGHLTSSHSVIGWPVLSPGMNLLDFLLCR